jgi:AAA domain-containing protein
VGKPIVVESLAVYTDTDSAVYQFRSGVNAVVGHIGSGKSSMLEMIKYGLGGRALVMPVVRDNVKRIVLRVRVGSSRLELSRVLGAHTIDVIDTLSNERIGTWATTNRQNTLKAGEMLMEAVGLPSDWRIPRSTRNPRGQTTLISFYDLYRYLYLDQNSIDKDVVGHSDKNLNIKREAVFELLYGLSSSRIVELARERGKFLQAAEQSRGAARNVSDFLRANNEADPLMLDLQRQEAAERQVDAENRLIALRSDITKVSPEGDLARQIMSMRERLTELEDSWAGARRDIEKDHSIIAQLELDEIALRREDAAKISLSGLDFVCCPRCLQGINNDTVGDGECLLCRQPLPESPGLNVAEKRRIDDQRKETRELLEEDQATFDRITTQIDSIRDLLGETLMRAEVRQSAPASPLLDEVSDASRAAAGAAARLEAVMAAQARWASHRRLLREAEEAEKAARDLLQEETRLRLELEEHSSRLVELSQVFNEILATLRDPWYREAHIDRETYLPIVDNEPFDMLSVGGARKTLVNLAYHLANLSMSLTYRDTILMPTLLIIDSPRKNVGEAALDRGVVEAVYRRLQGLQLAVDEPGGSEFQVIIADNEPPKSARGWLRNQITLDYRNPFVPGVHHEGEGVDTMGGTTTQELD